MLEVEFKGLRQLEAAMRELPKRVDRKILNDGLLAGARLVRDEARALAPELQDPDPRWQRGALKRAIRATRIRPRDYAAEVIVSVRKLSKRAVARVKARQAKAKAAGKKVRVGGRHIPGDAFYWPFVEFGTASMRARPFLRPAFEARKESAVQAAIKVFRERVQAEIAKLGSAFRF
jgi:HK97 gp10 family phage protein